MFRQFAQKVEEMRRLIENQRSASSVISGEPDESRNFFLLAVSGGMDSMCMADLFLRETGKDNFALAHCNFSLRGDESDGDEALVRDWAESNGVRLFVKRFDTSAYAKAHGISIEMAARDLRYGWFAELCQENDFAVLAVAHNANDNAETLMLNLLRGTGLSGLHGMAEVQCRVDLNRSGCDSASGEGNVILFRPLLEWTRKQIEGYVLAHKVPYRHDSSNFESDYKRNKIRNEVFPVFEKMNPSFVRTLNREIDYFTEAGSIVDDWCRSQMPSVVSGDCDGNGELVIDIAALLATPHWKYLLYYLLEPYGFNSSTLASIEALLASPRTISGKRFESATHLLLTGRDVMTVILRPSVSDEEDVAGAGVSEDIAVVRGHGTYHFNGQTFTVEVLPWDDSMSLKQPGGVLIMDADKLKFPFVCRRWRQGDWLIPFGMRGRKKVSDLFADLKYDTLAKDSAIIMVDTTTPGLAEQQHIAGLLAARIDDRYKVTPSTKQIVRVALK